MVEESVAATRASLGPAADAERVVAAVGHLERADPPVPPLDETEVVGGVTESLDDGVGAERDARIDRVALGVREVPGLACHDAALCGVALGKVPGEQRLEDVAVHARGRWPGAVSPASPRFDGL